VTTTRFARSEKGCCARCNATLRPRRYPPRIRCYCGSRVSTADDSVRECCCYLHGLRHSSPRLASPRSPSSASERSLAWRMAPVPTGFPDSRGVVLPARVILNPRVASCSHAAGPAGAATRSVRRIRSPPSPRAWPWRDVRSRPHSTRSLPAAGCCLRDARGAGKRIGPARAGCVAPAVEGRLAVSLLHCTV
jgi:hypothetical protein